MGIILWITLWTNPRKNALAANFSAVDRDGYISELYFFIKNKDLDYFYSLCPG